MSKKIGPWTQLNDKVVYDNPWISIHHQEVLNPNGNPGIYGTVHFKNLAIGILVLTENDETYLVGQHRYPLDLYTWEIPEGGGKLGVDPLDSAKRELEEECGLRAKSWEPLLTMHLSNSVSDEFAIIYIARDLEQVAAHPEDTEQLVVKKVPFEELYQDVFSGKITDSLTVAAVFKAKILRLEGKL